MADKANIRNAKSDIEQRQRGVGTSSIPLFTDNLQVARPGTVAASGTRAQAEVFGAMADVAKDISDFATQINTEQLVAKAQRGEISEADLPSPITRLGKAVRTGYAESQAIKTNIDIKNKIKEITENPALSEKGMETALINSANSMIAGNIPEMAGVIRNNFAGTGVSAIYNESKRRLSEQRELQAGELEASQEYWGREFTQAYSAAETNRVKVDKLAQAETVGPLPEDEYVKIVTGIDSTAEVRLANAKANLAKTLSARIAIGKMTPAQAEVAMMALTRDARDDFLAQYAVDNGIHTLDNVPNLTFDEKLSIAQKSATYSGMKNNEEDRVQADLNKTQQKQINGELQTARNLAIEGKYTEARAITNRISKVNEALGDSGVMAQLESVRADIDDIAASGGAPNPEIFADYKRDIQLGRYGTVEDVLQDLRFTGNKLNTDEITEIQKIINDLPETGLTSDSFKSAVSVIKTALPDDVNRPSYTQRALGEKDTPLQKQIITERNRIESALIEGVQTGTLKTPQQQRDYVEAETRKARKQLYASEIKEFKKTGLKPEASPVDIRGYVEKKYGSNNLTLSKQMFKKIIKAQQLMREVESD